MRLRRVAVALAAATFAALVPSARGADLNKVLHVAFVAPENGFDPQASSIVHPWVLGYKYDTLNPNPWMYLDLDLAQRRSATK